MGDESKFDCTRLAASLTGPRTPAVERLFWDCSSPSIWARKKKSSDLFTGLIEGMKYLQSIALVTAWLREEQQIYLLFHKALFQIKPVHP